MVKNFNSHGGGQPGNLSKEQLIALLQEKISAIWDNRLNNGEISQKINSGEPLNSTERALFISMQRRNIQEAGKALSQVIDEATANGHDLFPLLVGNQESSSRKLNKKLLFIDKEERFFIDVFVFGAHAETFKHSHNVACVSYQFAGELREVEYKQNSANWQELITIKRSPGTATFVSPYDGDIDEHVIHNDGENIAVTIHIYGQQVIGEDNVVTINRVDLSDAPLGPSSVKEYLSGNKNFQLALARKDIARKDKGREDGGAYLA